ncbi:mannonate dehydratase [Adhaeribacter aquaticus]|uniref:mannonate dehydratase n=1 Tax=Adhaeribacter aquaticus TaxID=299567 RepID=UPI000404C4CC|nr:mannonate dehydratase [Adhaeribacter aquaticus]
MKKNRRDFIKKGTALAALSVVGLHACTDASQAAEAAGKNDEPTGNQGNNSVAAWPISETASTPKILMFCALDADEKTIRRIKQMGVTNINGAYPANGPIPWQEAHLRKHLDRLKSQGLTVLNLMHPVSSNIVLGREGRDKDILNFKESLRVAGICGLPNVEYNFYVDRLDEGYYEMEGRGGSGVTGYDYSRVKDLPAKPEIGTHKANEIWANLTYFLKAVIPAAEKAGVRMALHPNDPVAQVAHGSDQIMANLAGWKRLISIVDSPANGITYDPGVTREMGEDPVEVCRYFASRDRINHMHYRNVTVDKDYDKYVECFIDEGQANLFAVMQEVLRNGYNRGLLPEHPHILDYDLERGGIKGGGVAGGGGGGGYAGDVFNVAFTRGLMMAAMSLPSYSKKV